MVPFAIQHGSIVSGTGTGERWGEKENLISSFVIIERKAIVSAF